MSVKAILLLIYIYIYIFTDLTGYLKTDKISIFLKELSNDVIKVLGYSKNDTYVCTMYNGNFLNLIYYLYTK